MADEDTLTALQTGGRGQRHRPLPGIVALGIGTCQPTPIDVAHGPAVHFSGCYHRAAGWSALPTHLP